MKRSSTLALHCVVFCVLLVSHFGVGYEVAENEYPSEPLSIVNFVARVHKSANELHEINATEFDMLRSANLSSQLVKALEHTVQDELMNNRSVCLSQLQEWMLALTRTEAWSLLGK